MYVSPPPAAATWCARGYGVETYIDLFVSTSWSRIRREVFPRATLSRSISRLRSSSDASDALYGIGQQPSLHRLHGAMGRAVALQPGGRRFNPVDHVKHFLLKIKNQIKSERNKIESLEKCLNYKGQKWLKFYQRDPRGRRIYLSE